MVQLAAASARAVVILILLGAALPFVWFATIKIWRLGLRYDPRTGFSRQWIEGAGRAMPAAAAMFTLGEAALALDVFGGRHAPGIRVVAVAAVAMALLAISARLLGRPRWAIPPALRDHPSGDRAA